MFFSISLEETVFGDFSVPFRTGHTFFEAFPSHRCVLDTGEFHTGEFDGWEE